MQVALARAYGVDVFIYGAFWSRGKRVLAGALDRGFSGSAPCADFPFAIMWANRMPRRVLPVKSPRDPLIDPSRLVHTDPEDFLAFVRFAAERYFARPNYYRRGGLPYLSIFDSSFFLRQLGLPLAARAIASAKRWLADNGYGGLHLAGVDPAAPFRAKLAEIGFDSVTHYVLLPEWKGDERQDYRACGERRIREWPEWKREVGLPYFPSVSPGWDATPRAADYRKARARRYPWSPIVTGSDPDGFAWLLGEAVRYAIDAEDDPIIPIASWNEWSEGHYLEPDERFGHGWLEAVKRVRGA